MPGSYKISEKFVLLRSKRAVLVLKGWSDEGDGGDRTEKGNIKSSASLKETLEYRFGKD